MEEPKKTLQNGESRLPVPSGSDKPSPRPGSTAQRSAIAAALLNLAPVAIEVVYGVARRLLSGPAGNRSGKKGPGKQGAATVGKAIPGGKAPGAAGSLRRRKGGRA